MRHLLTGVLALSLVVLGVRAADDDKKDDKKPIDQFKDIVKEAQGKLREAKTQDDRTKILKGYSPKFLKFAQDNAKDEAAFQALYVVVQIGQKETAKAFEILSKDYATKSQISIIVRFVGMVGADDNGAKFLKTVLEKNETKAIQQSACQALVTVAEKGMQNAAFLTDKDYRAEQEKSKGKDAVKKILDNAANYKKDMATYTKMLKDKFEVKGKMLYVGTAMPELKSKDLKDKDVTLSGLKGKVVVLDIWATWCPPCRAMIPHEREMVKKLKDKPFVLVSISADAKKETLETFLAKNPMPWTHWWNGDEGGILSQLNVKSYPTIYVLDHKGVIRFKNVRNKEMELAVTVLLKELEEEKKAKTE